MKEKTLIKISLIFSVIGIVFLYYLVGNVSLDEKEIDKINYIDQDIKIKGVVTNIDERDKVAFVEIAQPNVMKVVIFKDDELNLKINDYIEITGNVEEYNGKLQIIAEEVKR
tara:strand:+ start:310 stop:645 length:336 start_codon:yes stop_codon:yes gene_type:complete